MTTCRHPETGLAAVMSLRATNPVKTIGRCRRHNGVNVFYGDKQALFGVDLDIGEQRGDRADRAVRLRQVDLPALPQPHERHHRRLPGRPATSPWTARTSTTRPLDVVQLRARVGMVFQKPNPFPKSIYDNVAYGPRIHGRRRPRPSWTRSSRPACERAGLWDEVKDRLEEPGTGLSGGQQQRLCIARAIAVKPGGDPDGRALLGARPDRDGEDRGTDRRAARELHHRHRHPLHAAGGPRVAATAFFHLGELVEGGRYGDDLHQSRRTNGPRATSPAASADRRMQGGA